MVFYFCDTLANLKDLLFKKNSFFEVEKTVNFRGTYFRESSIFEIFRELNFRELLLQFEIRGIQFRKFAPNSRKFLLSKISSAKNSSRDNFFP